MIHRLTGPADTVSILSHSAFFNGLGRSRLDTVAALCARRDCDAAVQLYRIGDPAHHVYVLAEGSVSLSVGRGERTARTGDVLRRGDVFGWAAMTPGGNLRIATAACLVPCSLLQIDGAGLIKAMDADHTLGYLLVKQLNQLISGTLTAFAGG